MTHCPYCRNTKEEKPNPYKKWVCKECSKPNGRRDSDKLRIASER